VTQEELERLVQAYKKKSEYKERRLPVNAHFNIQDYKDSKNVMRESALHVNSAKGSKRGQITAQIYKKHGKNFTVQREVRNGGTTTNDDEPHIPASKQVRNQGSLTIRA